MPFPGPVGRTLDTALDRTIVGSMSSVGYRTRRRCCHWPADSVEVAGQGLAGRVVVVTGATSGMGQAAAVALARRGAHVVVHGRNPQKVTATLALLADEGAGSRRGSASGEIADLTSMGDVHGLADRLAADYPVIHALVNNAGTLFREHTVTAEGVEATAAVMVLAPFALVGRLAGQLGRVITVASAGLYGQRLTVDGIEATADNYRGAAAYARCKRAQLALTHQWESRLGLPARAMDPGWVNTPGLADGLPGFHRLMGPLLRTPEQGADTAVWLTSQSPMPGTARGLWRDRRARTEHLLNKTKNDASAEDRLWQWCEQRLDGISTG